MKGWRKMTERSVAETAFLPNKPLEDVDFIELIRCIRDAAHHDNERAREAVALALDEIDRRDRWECERRFKVFERIDELREALGIAHRRMRDIEEEWAR